MYVYLENTISRNAYWFAAWNPDGGRYWVGRGKIGSTPVVNMHTCPTGRESSLVNIRARAKIAGDYRHSTPTHHMTLKMNEIIGAPTPPAVTISSNTVTAGNPPTVVGFVNDVRVVPEYTPPARTVTVPKEPSRWDV